MGLAIALPIRLVYPSNAIQSSAALIKLHPQFEHVLDELREKYFPN